MTRTTTAERDRLIDTKEAATLLGLKPQTLINWRHLSSPNHPKGPRYRKLAGSRSVRYRLGDVLAFASSANGFQARTGTLLGD